MTAAELREKIRVLIPQVYANVKQGEEAAIEFDELTKFPELKSVITDLLSHEFDNFLSSIDWVAPKPSTFRINLKNSQDFYLIYSRRSWIAQIEGKKYYLLNLPEEERATEAIARILRYGVKVDTEAVEGEDNVDVDIDDNVEI
tara:strand:+ start:1642 stop:2073 length:432 start_codon:yes stop_codon:yes gene_type:complete